ncbi:hypothetical protein POP12_096 [Pectobacterium phage POP12]|nr:hypothetical protein POP12_096 [Pectobacterium phage POP12]
MFSTIGKILGDKFDEHFSKIKMSIKQESPKTYDRYDPAYNLHKINGNEMSLTTEQQEQKDYYANETAVFKERLNAELVSDIHRERISLWRQVYIQNLEVNGTTNEVAKSRADSSLKAFDAAFNTSEAFIK